MRTGSACSIMQKNTGMLPVAVVVLVAAVLVVVMTYTVGTHLQQFAHADSPDITVSIDKDTYQYCENLAYSISVSEVTGQVAVAHITDQNGKKSQPIPIEINMLQSTIRAPFPFEKSIFPTGTYTVEVQYAGAQASDSFELIDGDSTCMPAQIKQIAAAWLSGTFSDGFFIDAIAKSVDSSMINVPFEINQDVIYEITIPEWVKQATYWWITGQILDGEMARMLDYLLESQIISAGPAGTGGA